MSKSLKVIIALLALFVGYFLISVYSSSKKDLETVQYLETQVIPYLQNNNIIKYTNRDWCKMLIYASTSVNKISKDSDPTCNGPLKNKQNFSPEDQLIFDQLNSKLTGFRDVDTEYPLAEVEHAKLKRDPLGIAFHANCSFCSFRYVYAPGYQELPPDIEYEITYTPLNSNWFRIDQDWN